MKDKKNLSVQPSTGRVPNPETIEEALANEPFEKGLNRRITQWCISHSTAEPEVVKNDIVAHLIEHWDTLRGQSYKFCLQNVDWFLQDFDDKINTQKTQANRFTESVEGIEEYGHIVPDSTTPASTLRMHGHVIRNRRKDQ